MDQRAHLSPASPEEEIVYGACRPGYYTPSEPDKTVDEWIEQLHVTGIERICCLLETLELQRYSNLLRSYEEAFGEQAVRHVPLADYAPIEPDTFRNDILPFLRAADLNSESVVVHCSAGMGRTGQVLALWLSVERGYGLEVAIRDVESMGRRPLEAASRNHLRAVMDD